MNDWLGILESLPGETVTLGRADARAWFDAWCRTFCDPVHTSTGKFRYRDLHWHAFSWGLVQALQGKAALDAYSAELPLAVLVIPESWEQTCGVEYRGASPPDLSRAATDLYVFPRSLTWTAAFTHEQPGIGPFFVRAEWCTPRSSASRSALGP